MGIFNFPRKTLVVGSKIYGGEFDRRAIYGDDVTGIDLEHGDGVDIIHDLEQPINMTFKHIDCNSVLEHVRRPWVMCENLEFILEPGGTIFVKVPFVWRVHNYPGDFWRISAQGLAILFPNIKWVTAGYLTQSGFRKVIESKNINDIRYLKRTETIAFGVKAK